MNPDRPSAALRLLTPLFAGLWLAACQTATQRDAPPASGPPRVEARPAGGVAAAHRWRSTPASGSWSAVAAPWTRPSRCRRC
jgi:hypothetical protein